MSRLLLIVFLFSAKIVAQEAAPDISSAFEEEAILEFNDGTQLEGYAIIKHEGWAEPHDMIKFRLTPDGKADLWDETMCAGVFIKHEGILHEYKFVQLTKRDLHPRLLKVFSEGEVMLYGDVSINDQTITVKPQILETTVRNGSKHFGNTYKEVVTFYLKRESDPYPVKLWGMLGWKKMAKTYFANCPELIEKIDNREFTTNHIQEMVDFYNTNCGM